MLLRSTGPFTAILPVGVLFGAMHSSNPHASNLGLVNTAGFGMLFGYAFWRSRDLWLPFGLHFRVELYTAVLWHQSQWS